jgi:C4-type Zn-finger protein
MVGKYALPYKTRVQMAIIHGYEATTEPCPICESHLFEHEGVEIEYSPVFDDHYKIVEKDEVCNQCGYASNKRTVKPYTD